MANAKTSYSITDILGPAVSREEALTRIQSDPASYEAYQSLNASYQNSLLQFVMGQNGLAITYDKVFRAVMLPGDTTDRLAHFLSIFFDAPVQVQMLLQREGSQIDETSHLVIADIIAKMSDQSLVNVEIQKIGYAFPGERSSCYTSDMIMRQYNYLKNKNPNFSYHDMKSVYLIVLMEKSPQCFRTDSGDYIHRMRHKFDTGIKVNLLDHIIFVSLDTFDSVKQNISTEQDAWMTFLTATDPDEIVHLVNAYPEFLACYHDLISFRTKPKELIYMFSDALRQMDHNTELYMIEELHNELRDTQDRLSSVKTALSSAETELSSARTELSSAKTELAKSQQSNLEKDLIIKELERQLAERQ